MSTADGNTVDLRYDNASSSFIAVVHHGCEFRVHDVRLLGPMVGTLTKVAGMDMGTPTTKGLKKTYTLQVVNPKSGIWRAIASISPADAVVKSACYTI